MAGGGGGETKCVGGNKVRGKQSEGRGGKQSEGKGGWRQTK